MKRSELAAELQKPFGGKNRWGVVKAKDPRFKNLWFVIPPPPPTENPYLGRIPALAKAHQILQKMPSLREATPLDRLISFLFLRREAVQSSRMEGTWSTIDQIFTPQSTPGPSDHASVKNYAVVLDKVFRLCERKGYHAFSVSIIQTLHREIMRQDPNFHGTPGGIRQVNGRNSIVFIGGLRRLEESIYNPVPPPYVLPSLRSVVAWFKNMSLIEFGNAGMGMSLPIRLAIGHAHFEAVHPFPDGNGRVGRMILAMQMVCDGIIPLFLSGFIESQRGEYTRCLSLAQKRLHYAPIVEFFSEAIVAAFDEAEKTKSAITGLPKMWGELGKFRDRSTAKRALSWIISTPIFSAEDLRKALKVSAPAAHRAVGQLVAEGIIRERTGFGRNRIFAVEEIVALLARPFGEAPKSALRRAKVAMRSSVSI